MAIIEAMRCGVPVLSPNCPLRPAEIISDGVDGRLVPVGDRHAVARALEDLIEDPAQRGTWAAQPGPPPLTAPPRALMGCGRPHEVQQSRQKPPT
ncbi:glycosyltransferase [Streptomyces sp. NPDC058293]|uniref:glycosyltransferase n=1 Tax=Streptomyces sp. NPDC058293 TaxID=3346429 RepID=UPI0036E2FBB1